MLLCLIISSFFLSCWYQLSDSDMVFDVAFILSYLTALDILMKPLFAITLGLVRLGTMQLYLLYI